MFTHYTFGIERCTHTDTHTHTHTHTNLALQETDVFVAAIARWAEKLPRSNTKKEHGARADHNAIDHHEDRDVVEHRIKHRHNHPQAGKHEGAQHAKPHNEETEAITHAPVDPGIAMLHHVSARVTVTGYLASN